jgi:hypothetical protein
MNEPWKIDVRPRTLGEILDDAWRLYLHQPLLLLVLSGLFTVPLAIVLLLLLTEPPAETAAGHLLLPALASLLLITTGLGSGACQAAFHRLAEGKAMTLGSGLRGAFGRGLDHLGARALVLLGLAFGCVFLVIPAVMVWVAGACLHPVLAAEKVPLLGAMQSAAREVQRSPARAFGAVSVRLVLLVFVVLNLYLIVEAVLWVADDLAGLSVPLLPVLCSWRNPTFVTALVLVAWVLLAPYAEAVNYLLHVDARARYEGLDLWYRTQRHFPTQAVPAAGVRRRAPTTRALGLVLLALGTGLCGARPARAADERQLVHEARQQVAAIKQEVVSAEPYPGSARWAPRLGRLADRLDPPARAGRRRFRWFREGIAGFGHCQRDDAVRILNNLEKQLDLAEDSLAAPPAAGREAAPPALSKQAIKQLVPSGPDDDQGQDAGARERARRREERKAEKPVTQDDPDASTHRRGRRTASGAFGGGLGGLATVGWFLVAGLVAAILVMGCVLFVQQRRRTPRRTKPAQVTPAEVPDESALCQLTPQTAAGLWKQADDLARQGNFLGAVRALYLAVLAQLHSVRLIRYERTRTNGEYVAQLRPQPAVQQPFRDLTAVFDLKWYGERACRPDDYTACRDFADHIRQEARLHGG